MSLIELIAFVAGLFALILLATRRAKEERHRRRHPEHHVDDTKNMTLQEWIRSFEPPHEEGIKKGSTVSREKPLPIHEKETRPQAVQKAAARKTGAQSHKDDVRKGTSHAPAEDSYFLKNSLKDSYREEIVSSRFLKQEASAYDIDRLRSRPSRGTTMLRALPSSKNMVIIKEVFGPPKGFSR